MSTVESQSIRKEAGIEGSLEFGQKNISTLKRNLLNADEILRIPHNKLLVNIRGNKPLMLEKMIYTEHPLAGKLKDMPISTYKPNWDKKNLLDNSNKRIESSNREIKKSNEFVEITFDNF